MRDTERKLGGGGPSDFIATPLADSATSHYHKPLFTASCMYSVLSCTLSNILVPHVGQTILEIWSVFVLPSRSGHLSTCINFVLFLFSY